MRSCDSGQVVGVVELLGDVLSEAVARTTGGDAPTTSVIGVGPEEIADGTFVGNFLDAVELSDLVKGVDRGGKTTMEAENLVLDDSSEGEVIEKLGELLPHVSVAVLAEALVVESVPMPIKDRLIRNKLEK